MRRLFVFVKFANSLPNFNEIENNIVITKCIIYSGSRPEWQYWHWEGLGILPDFDNII